MSATSLDKVKLSEKTLAIIKNKARQWANLHGVQMRPQSDARSLSYVEYAPMTLFPSIIPYNMVQEAKSIQKYFNKLMHDVANDHDFLQQTLRHVIKVDDFTKRLWDIYLQVKSEGISQPVSLGLFRNDYMMDVKDSCCDIRGLPVNLNLKQIEFNTIAASFGGLASGIWNVHRYNLRNAGMPFNPEQVPVNLPSEGIAGGLVKAWEIYNEQSAVILMVVQDEERNTLDQLWIEKQMFEINEDIRMVYASLTELWQHARIDDNKKLRLYNDEVAVVYYRDGYSPDHYPTHKEWDVRLRIEQSHAIKAPTVALQLAGCKKIQQELAAPGVLESFCKDTRVCRRLRQTFAGQYSLDMGEVGNKAVSMVMANPHDYVLKPQREGGGNNLYGEDIKTFLCEIGDSEERNAYILMERIFPWPQKNYLLKEGKPSTLQDVISELGIYGAYIGTATKEYYNEEIGHLLRTKSNSDNEGGIMAGFATIDSPLLVDCPGCQEIEKNCCLMPL